MNEWRVIPPGKLNRPPISKKEPEAIYLLDANTGQTVSIDPKSIPESIRPQRWFENPHWRHNNYLSEELVLQFLNREKLTRKKLWKLGKYILYYAQNTATAGWMFSPQAERAGYLEFMEPCIARLKKVLARTPFDMPDAQEMLSIGLDYVVDPI